MSTNTDGLVRLYDVPAGGTFRLAVATEVIDGGYERTLPAGYECLKAVGGDGDGAWVSGRRIRVIGNPRVLLGRSLA